MNGSGLFLVAVLIAVLIAVAFGASQIQADQASRISEAEDLRNQSVQIAQEAKTQRDNAVTDREAAIADRNKIAGDLDKANERVTVLEADLTKANERASALETDLTKANDRASALEASLTQANDRSAALEADRNKAAQDLASAQAQIADLQNQLAVAQAAEQPMPVTGQPAENSKAICLPGQAGALPNQLGIALAVLVGMVALGSGGYIVYRQDPNRKYTVKMTKEQIHDYARYQRERGNRAA